GYFVPSNLRQFEETLRSGSPEVRAVIGSTLWSSRATGPWTERLFLVGLLDQDPDVRSEFHRARDHFRPLSPEGRQRLEEAARGGGRGAAAGSGACGCVRSHGIDPRGRPPGEGGKAHEREPR